MEAKEVLTLLFQRGLIPLKNPLDVAKVQSMAAVAQQRNYLTFMCRS